MTTQLKHVDLTTNRIRLHCVMAGPDNGPAIVLLHGFPEFWYGWRHQIDFFAYAGYRVIVPDQRGYNLSDKPDGLRAYNVDILAADVVGMLDALGCESAFLAGHDWGGIVAWRVANKFPSRITRLVILNVPHPAVIKRALRRSWRQRSKSWYVFFFQIPRLPEWCARFANWKFLSDSMLKSSRPGTFFNADMDSYREAWSRPGAIRSMIHWYRALLQTRAERLPSPRITVPTLLLWGENDRFIGKELAALSLELCDHGRLVLFEETSHWIQHEEPDRVNQLMLEFLRESKPETSLV